MTPERCLTIPRKTNDRTCHRTYVAIQTCPKGCMRRHIKVRSATTSYAILHMASATQLLPKRAAREATTPWQTQPMIAKLWTDDSSFTARIGATARRRINLVRSGVHRPPWVLGPGAPGTTRLTFDKPMQQITTTMDCLWTRLGLMCSWHPDNNTPALQEAIPCVLIGPDVPMRPKTLE